MTDYPKSVIDGEGRSALEGAVPGVKGAAVGRIVHYYQVATKVPLLEQQPRAGIITEVHDQQGHVALELFGFPERVVHRSVAFAPVGRPGCWTWPPRV